MPIISADGGGAPSSAMPLHIVARTRSYTTTPPPMKKEAVTHLVIHHAAAKVFSPDQVWDCHLNAPPEKGGPWRGAGYNFYIRKDGTVHEMHGFNYQGIHCPGYNSKSMGICCEGNYEEESVMPKAQMTSLVRLSHICIERFPSIRGDISRVGKHGILTTGGATACPGKLFPWTDYLSKLAYSLRSSALYAVTQGVSPAISDGSYGGNITGGGSGGTSAGSEFGLYITTSADTSWAIVAAKVGMTESSMRLLNTITAARPITGMKIMYKRTPMTNALEESLKYDDIALAAVEVATQIHVESVIESYYENTDNSGLFRLVKITNTESEINSKQFNRPSLSDLKGLKETKYGYKNDRRHSFDANSKSNEFEKFKIYVQTKDGIATYMFKIDPTQMAEARSRMITQIRTNGGYIIVDNGPSSPSMTLSGVMLDYDGESERTEFLAFYKAFIETGNYKKIYMHLEGVLYAVEILGVQTNGSGQQGTIKNYTMSIMVLNDTIGTSEITSIVASPERAISATVSTNVIPDLATVTGSPTIERR